MEALFLNVMKHSDPRPFARGVYTSMPQALQGLHGAGVNPGYCHEYKIKDEDGEVRSVLYSTDKYIITMTMLPVDVAMALASEKQMWVVPDEMEV